MRRHISPETRRRRMLAVPIVLALVVMLAWAWFAVTKLWFPRLDPVPDDVDVIVQLGGAYGQDYMNARQLAVDRGVHDLVISEPTGIPKLHDRYCAPLTGVTVHCFAPDPSTTRGEARGFAALAEENGWHSAYVVGTNREHTARVRLYFERCWDGELAVNRPGSPRSFTEHLYQAGYQTAGWLRAVRNNAC
ncbi:hypothetical protein [Corynebacterium variabile]|uniref:Putative secreted protein n=1 Tax=Corynebacterium variabile (strain DSM 44702 / CIP 107183 / JCM 12073 / NCIMB 30131) TaxID=858619 RepID=G0HCT2_CORVD|nr:hypothetical protein [Corynebacterium variabile]AEK35657.1 putative secreted protein [Corynebacterium variabile DSM 44702]